MEKPEEFMKALGERVTLKEGSVKEPDLYLGADVKKIILRVPNNMPYLYKALTLIRVNVGYKIYMYIASKDPVDTSYPRIRSRLECIPAISVYEAIFFVVKALILIRVNVWYSKNNDYYLFQTEFRYKLPTYHKASHE